jgi:hypothetical protein
MCSSSRRSLDSMRASSAPPQRLELGLGRQRLELLFELSPELYITNPWNLCGARRFFR